MSINVNKQNRIKNILQINFLITLSLTFLPQYFTSSPNQIETPQHLKEVYNPHLAYITSVEDFEADIARRLHHNFSDTSALVNTIDDVLRQRFYHGYSEYNLSHNWIAYLCGKWLWYGFLHPVIEDDILKYPMAACSQQGLVFQAMLKNHGIAYGTVGFGYVESSPGGHYTVNAYYNNSWHFFDSNQEPIKIKGNPPIDSLIKDSLFVAMYPNLDKQWLKQKVQLHLVEAGNVNKFNAPKMYIFHTITSFLSAWLWCLCLIPLFILEMRKYFIKSLIFQTSYDYSRQYAEVDIKHLKQNPYKKY